MRFVLRSALKDLRRQAADPAATLLWFGIPVAIAAMIVLAFGGKETKAPVAELLVADLDSSFVSNLVVQGLGRAPVIHVTEVDREDGRRRIEKGEGSAFLVLPKGFRDAVLNRVPMTLNLVVNPSERVLPGIVTETLSMMVDAVFYLQETAGDRIDAFLAREKPAGGFDSAVMASFAADMNDLITKARPVLLPPALKVVIDKPPKKDKEEEGPSLGFLFFPGILFMALLFMAQGLAGDLWIEKKNGTLRRAVASPGGPAPLLAGKILAGALMGAAVGTVAMIFGRFWFGIPAARLLPGLAWAVFFTAVFIALLVVLQSLAPTQKSGNLITSLIVFPLLMVGGSFFPFEAMPPGMAAIGRLTPNGRALAVLESILLGRATAGEVLPVFVALAVVGGLAFLVTARRLRRFAMEA